MKCTCGGSVDEELGTHIHQQFFPPLWYLIYLQNLLQCKWEFGAGSSHNYTKCNLYLLWSSHASAVSKTSRFGPWGRAELHTYPSYPPHWCHHRAPCDAQEIKKKAFSTPLSLVAGSELTATYRHFPVRCEPEKNGNLKVHSWCEAVVFIPFLPLPCSANAVPEMT